VVERQARRLIGTGGHLSRLGLDRLDHRGDVPGRFVEEAVPGGGVGGIRFRVGVKQRFYLGA
jgi:hypothetical protein